MFVLLLICVYTLFYSLIKSTNLQPSEKIVPTLCLITSFFLRLNYLLIYLLIKLSGIDFKISNALSVNLTPTKRSTMS